MLLPAALAMGCAHIDARPGLAAAKPALQDPGAAHVAPAPAPTPAAVWNEPSKLTDDDLDEAAPVRMVRLTALTVVRVRLPAAKPEAKGIPPAAVEPEDAVCRWDGKRDADRDPDRWRPNGDERQRKRHDEAPTGATDRLCDVRQVGSDGDDESNGRSNGTRFGDNAASWHCKHEVARDAGTGTDANPLDGQNPTPDIRADTV